MLLSLLPEHVDSCISLSDYSLVIFHYHVLICFPVNYIFAVNIISWLRICFLSLLDSIVTTYIFLLVILSRTMLPIILSSSSQFIVPVSIFLIFFHISYVFLFLISTYVLIVYSFFRDNEFLLSLLLVD